MIVIDDKILESLIKKAADSPRKRVHYNLHPDLNDKIHRLCVAIEPGSYIRPHRHFNPQKWELMVILRGKMAVLLFNDTGKVIDKIELTPGTGNSSVEIPYNTWHTFISMEPGSVIFEIKSGPYFKPVENDFAAWAPNEGSEAAEKHEKWFRTAKVGDAVNMTI